MANQAAWFHEKGGPFTVGEAPMHQPAANEIILRSHAIAFNPADAVVWKTGLFVTEWPAVVGCDVAGIVAAVGNGMGDAFKIGDRVLAAPNWSAKDRINKGSGQLYCAAVRGLIAILPDNVSFTDGCVLPAAMATAASMLYQKGNLELPLPKLDVKSKENPSVLLVWAGSSSVGSCAIQLAVAAGFEVATTCSSHNFGYCKDLGANFIFDHASPTVVDDIVAALKGKSFAGAFDAVMYPESIINSAQIAHQLGGKQQVATVLPPMAASHVPAGLPEDVIISFCYSTTISEDEVGPATFDWLTEALAKGLIRCKPDPVIVGQGLESVQAAVERMEKGVSAAKLVVELP
ncbi:hypothetical protein LTR17_025080 [Elasticomyces elasticus]|nr:hypothetical protein LTR17_025080 [Elasticomyces elasticus]